MTSSPLAHRLSFQDNALGTTLARLFFVSLVVSIISFGLGMNSFGFNSLFIVPSAFFVTLIHHIVLWRRLIKYKKNTTTPLCDTPPCLKHAGNIWTLFLWATVWLTGGSLSIAFIAISWVDQYSYIYSNNSWAVSTGLEMASALLAVIEGTLLMTIMALCYRALGREGYAGTICTRPHKDTIDDAESSIFEKN